MVLFGKTILLIHFMLVTDQVDNCAYKKYKSRAVKRKALMRLKLPDSGPRWS